MRVNLKCGAALLQKDSINFSFGCETEKKRWKRDSSDSEAKNRSIASLSVAWATRTIAVVPSRKMSRPDSGESWEGTGRYRGRTEATALTRLCDDYFQTSKIPADKDRKPLRCATNAVNVKRSARKRKALGAPPGLNTTQSDNQGNKFSVLRFHC